MIDQFGESFRVGLIADVQRGTPALLQETEYCVRLN